MSWVSSVLKLLKSALSPSVLIFFQPKRSPSNLYGIAFEEMTCVTIVAEICWGFHLQCSGMYFSLVRLTYKLKRAKHMTFQETFSPVLSFSPIHVTSIAKQNMFACAATPLKGRMDPSHISTDPWRSAGADKPVQEVRERPKGNKRGKGGQNRLGRMEQCLT